MQHIAIDLGGTESQVCVRASDGQILTERKLRNDALQSFLQRQEPSRVILETCSEAFRVADWAKGSHHDVRVVPSMLVRTLGVGARRTKTDRKDAQVLSEVSCRIELRSVHVPTDLARERRSMCTAREELVSVRTALVCSVRGWMRTQLLKARTGDVTTFSARVRAAALKHQDGLPAFIERPLQVIDTLNEQIALADNELGQLAKEDPICQRLMSVPGVGPVTSMRFVAAVDDVSRFASAHSVQSFLGLTPGENSSSKKQQRTGITKAGPPQVRRALVQAAWNLRRLRPHDPLSQWALRVEQRRRKFVATVAVARKLAGILFARWRDGTTYNPTQCCLPEKQ